MVATFITVEHLEFLEIMEKAYQPMDSLLEQDFEADQDLSRAFQAAVEGVEETQDQSRVRAKVSLVALYTRLGIVDEMAVASALQQGR
jgi:hypothetical protein